MSFFQPQLEPSDGSSVNHPLADHEPGHSPKFTPSIKTLTRVLFHEIESEAEDYADRVFHEYPAAEDTDPSDVAQWAMEEGIELYDSLSIMKSNHLLMTVTMLFHMWEQQLICFTIRELTTYTKLGKKVFSWRDVKDILCLYGIRIEETEVWPKIRELRVLANTVKHGDGHSARDLREIRPDFFASVMLPNTDTLELSGSVLLDAYSLHVSDCDLFDYVEATKGFWDEMPERALADLDSVIKVLRKKQA